MAPRLDLQAVLVDLLESDSVYFQPPASVSLVYPCIVYKRDNIDVSHADNTVYANKRRYQVTVMDKDPDSEIPEKVLMLPYCSYDRNYAVDNLNHDVFNLFF